MKLDKLSSNLYYAASKANMNSLGYMLEYVANFATPRTTSLENITRLALELCRSRE